MLKCNCYGEGAGDLNLTVVLGVGLWESAGEKPCRDTHTQRDTDTYTGTDTQRYTGTHTGTETHKSIHIDAYRDISDTHTDTHTRYTQIHSQRSCRQASQ